MNSAATLALATLLAPLRRLASRRTAAQQPLEAMLAPDDPVRTLDCAPGCRATLQVLAGRAWITQHGDGEDWFLEAGQQLALPGPGRLYASAEGNAPLRLRWVVDPAPRSEGVMPPAASPQPAHGPAGPRRAPARWRSGPGSARPAR